MALQWDVTLPWLEVLDRTETLRRQLASALQVPEQAVDLIELRRANLAMRAAVAEEGVILSGDNTLDWERFFAPHLARAGRLLLGPSPCVTTSTWRKPAAMERHRRPAQPAGTRLHERGHGSGAGAGGAGARAVCGGGFVGVVIEVFYG